jgi:hypothetical protein
LSHVYQEIWCLVLISTQLILLSILAWELLDQYFCACLCAESKWIYVQRAAILRISGPGCMPNHISPSHPEQIITSLLYSRTRLTRSMDDLGGWNVQTPCLWLSQRTEQEMRGVEPRQDLGRPDWSCRTYMLSKWKGKEKFSPTSIQLLTSWPENWPLHEG